MSTKYKIEGQTLTDIADAIRTNTGSTETINPSEFADKVQDVYDAGAKSEYDRFWDKYQNYGNGMFWGTSGFKGYEWSDAIFLPKYDIFPPSGDARSFFQYCTCKNLRESIDGRGLHVNLTRCTTLNMWFREASTRELPDMDTSNITNMTELVYKASSVHTIPRLNMTKVTSASNAFTGATALKNITFEGTIPISISFKDCTLLTHDSLMSIINHLYDYASEGSTATHTLTLGTTNLAKLTDEEKAIATQRGWTLA